MARGERLHSQSPQNRRLGAIYAPPLPDATNLVLLRRRSRACAHRASQVRTSLALGTPLRHRVRVPFPIEAPLSSLNFGGAMAGHGRMRYRRSFALPAAWGWPRRCTVRLHFGAVDWAALVYVNGARAATHSGGYTPFSVDIDSKLHLARGGGGGGGGGGDDNDEYAESSAVNSSGGAAAGLARRRPQRHWIEVQVYSPPTPPTRPTRLPFRRPSIGLRVTFHRPYHPRASHAPSTAGARPDRPRHRPAGGQATLARRRHLVHERERHLG